MATHKAGSPERKKRAAKAYVSECKRCTYIAKDKPVGIRTVKRNLEGKSPISCTMCGSKGGHRWLPVAEES